MPPKLAKWLILIALLTYAVLVSSWADTQVRARKCTGIQVDILQGANGQKSPLKESAVLSELGSIAQKYASMSLYSINTDSLENYLNTVSNFEHAEVVRTSLGRLLISVTPLLPEARIFTPTESYYINKDGKRMDAKAEYYVDLPIVHGNFTERMPAAGVLPVVRYIQADPLLRSLITMIDYQSPTNIMLIPRIRGHVINLGDTSNLPGKFEKLLLMYRKVMPHMGWNTYDTISLKFKSQIVATRADKSLRQHAPTDTTTFEDWEEKSIPTVEEQMETEAIINGTTSPDSPE